MYVSFKWSVWTLFSNSTTVQFRSHSHLWLCHKFHCGNSEKNVRFILTALLSRFYCTHCVQKVSFCSTFLFCCRWFSSTNVTCIPSFLVFAYPLFPHLDMWTRLSLPLAGKSFCKKCDVLYTKYSFLVKPGVEILRMFNSPIVAVKLVHRSTYNLSLARLCCAWLLFEFVFCYFFIIETKNVSKPLLSN